MNTYTYHTDTNSGWELRIYFGWSEDAPFVDDWEFSKDGVIWFGKDSDIPINDAVEVLEAIAIAKAAVDPQRVFHHIQEEDAEEFGNILKDIRNANLRNQ